MLCRVPTPFVNAFATLQEWELNRQTGDQLVRLDFLSRISMPPSTPYESAAYYEKLRSATIGGFNRSISKEIQRFHLIDSLFSRDESLTILRELNFFRRPAGDWEQFIAQIESTTPDTSMGQSAVVLPDLLDVVETIPVASLTTETVVQLHDLRNRRFQRLQTGRC